MNIFFLHHDPAVAAKLHHDVHARKMVTEATQILSAVARVVLYDNDIPVYKMPSGNKMPIMWALKSRDNFTWLLDHAVSLASVNRKYLNVSCDKQREVLSFIIEHRNEIEMNIKPGRFSPEYVFDITKVPECYSPDVYSGYNTYYRLYKMHDKNDKFIGSYTGRPSLTDYLLKNGES